MTETTPVFTTATPPNEERTTGIVKWFDSRGGFGFITILPEEKLAGKDIFVHYTSLNVNHSQYKYLVLGEYVEFTLSKSENDKYEYTAKSVSGIRGGNLMCESKRLSMLESPLQAAPPGIELRPTMNRPKLQRQTTVHLPPISRQVSGDGYVTVSKQRRRTAK
jgi:cold shock CspA family protein